ncbi:hypothetical protein ABZX92_15040 [Lentzea sp. NPDC006480]|uniref:RICIN domain-containing protein n=1 Tax=Lentzea sp. NPDC006480 TaxID=3157176 RepID=UPI0033AF1EA8
MGMKKLCVALVATALGAVIAAPASAAQEQGNRIIEIKNVAYGECLQTGEEVHASPLVVACSGAVGQQWEVIAVEGGRQLLRNLASRECLSERFASYYCDDQGVDEFAALVPEPSGAVRVKLGDGDRYLTGFAWPSGKRDAWYQPLGDRDDQRWQVREAGTRPTPDTAGQVVRLVPVEGDKYPCAGVEDTRLVSVACADTPEQKFQRIEAGDGATLLRSVVSGKCVAVGPAGSFVPEVTSDCSPDEVLQKWSIEPTRAGSARIRQHSYAQYLTPGETGVFMYPRLSYTAQLWELVPA